jgi:hypothetical protein
MNAPILGESEAKTGADERAKRSGPAEATTNAATTAATSVLPSSHEPSGSFPDAVASACFDEPVDGGLLGSKPLKKRRVHHRPPACVPTTTLQRQVASCWLDPPLLLRGAAGSPGWAEIVATTAPTSGPYLYDDDAAAAAVGAAPPGASCLFSDDCHLSRVALPRSRDSATAAPPEHGAPAPSLLDDSELEMETLAAAKPRGDDKTLPPGGPKGFLGASVTPSPFPPAPDSAAATPTSGGGPGGSKPTCISRIAIAGDNMPFLLPDFEARPSRASPLAARAQKKHGGPPEGGAAAAEAPAMGIGGSPNARDRGRGGAFLGRSAFHARLLLGGEGPGGAAPPAAAGRGGASPRRSSGPAAAAGAAARKSKPPAAPAHSSPKKPPPDLFVPRPKAYPKYSPLARHPSKTQGEKGAAAAAAAGAGAGGRPSVIVRAEDGGAAPPAPPQRRGAAAGPPGPLTLLDFLEMQHEAHRQKLRSGGPEPARDPAAESG